MLDASMTFATGYDYLICLMSPRRLRQRYAASLLAFDCCFAAMSCRAKMRRLRAAKVLINIRRRLTIFRETYAATRDCFAEYGATLLTMIICLRCRRSAAGTR